MGMTCIVIGCGSRRGRDLVSFYTVPTVLSFKHNIKKNELSKTRRQRWLEEINRSDLTASKIKWERVCSRHFLTGNLIQLVISFNFSFIILHVR